MKNLKYLQDFANEIRYHSFSIWKKKQIGALSGAFSVAEIYSFVFNKYLADSSSKYVFIPKTTSALSYYSAHFLIGNLTLRRLCRFGEKSLPGIIHKNRFTKTSVVSLGQSISHGIGIAITQSERNFGKTIVCVGDGELQEGFFNQLSFVVTKKINNFCLVIDFNGFQSYQEVNRNYNYFDLDENGEPSKFIKICKTLGFRVIFIDGHNISQIRKAFTTFETIDKPCIIIAKTIKGKGLGSQFENNYKASHRIPNDSIEETEKHINLLRNTNFKLNTTIKYQVKKRLNNTIKRPNNTEIISDEYIGMTLINWLDDLKKINNKNVKFITTDNHVLFKNVFHKSHIDVGINERLALNIAYSLGISDQIPIVVSPIVHMRNSLDEWRTIVMDKSKVIVIGMRPGLWSSKDWGISHQYFNDVEDFNITGSIVLQPSCNADMIYLLNKLLEQKDRLLPVYFRLPTVWDFGDIVFSDNEREDLDKNGFYFLRYNKKKVKKYKLIIGSGLTAAEIAKALKGSVESSSIVAINIVNLTKINVKLVEKLINDSTGTYIFFEGVSTTIKRLLPQFVRKIKVFTVDDWGFYGPLEKAYEKYSLNSQSILRIINET